MLSIGDVAARTGVAVTTLRWWEERGVLQPAGRVSGNRRYEATALRHVALVRMCQRAGFSLAEIAALLGGRSADEPAARSWEALARRKLPELDAVIVELQELRDTVASCLECRCMSFEHCQLLHSR
jgi:MerR family redox-sensitive transcriptional activator SoxR